MLNEKEAVEKELLLLLRDSTQPAGCGSLCAALQARGFRISEATTGRLLRDFDLQSYTEKSGYQGRCLSSAGEARLQQLLQRERRQQWREELTSAVQGHTKEELLEVLVARDAIEGALAALAAQNATPDDVVALTHVLTRQQLRAETDQVAADEDVAFHEELARIAGNKILRASIGLIRQDHQLSPVLETIRRKVGGKIHIDHQRIVDAIRVQDPEAAKAAMHQHITGLIHDVEKYWDES
jgi:GntR family transcriptional regulator, transcriptional repressor for pyruvate dehydrogenase complex